MRHPRNQGSEALVEAIAVLPRQLSANGDPMVLAFRPGGANNDAPIELWCP